MSGVNPQGVRGHLVQAAEQPTSSRTTSSGAAQLALPGARARSGSSTARTTRRCSSCACIPSTSRARAIDPAAGERRGFWKAAAARTSPPGSATSSRCGTRIVKFFLNVSREEQRERFLSRAAEEREALEVLGRPTSPSARTGTPTRRPTSEALRAHEHRRGAVVRDPRRPQVGDAHRRRRDHRPPPGADGPAVPRAERRRRAPRWTRRSRSSKPRAEPRALAARLGFSRPPSPPAKEPAVILLNPARRTHAQPDARSGEIMRKTIEFFEAKGKERLKADDHARVWYADFLDFVTRGARLRDAADAGRRTAPTRRRAGTPGGICEFAEILGFYGLPLLVHVAGLGARARPDLDEPERRARKRRAAQALEDGGIFAFGLSEQAHGADIYSTDMVLDAGRRRRLRRATARSTTSATATRRRWSRRSASVDRHRRVRRSSPPTPQHEQLPAASRTSSRARTTSPSSRSTTTRSPRPTSCTAGDDAWDAALNTVNIGKYNLGWASIGICTHALYEAITHAAQPRASTSMHVTDFPHVRRMFVDAYARLVAMKLFALRAADYMRSASREDRRYLLYNPMVKMKVTTEGERGHQPAVGRDRRQGLREGHVLRAGRRATSAALPKLEGTVHVNIALIVKFMPSYFFDAGRARRRSPRRDDAANDDFLFDQGADARPRRRSGSTTTERAFDGVDSAERRRSSREQAGVSARCCVVAATPTRRSARTSTSCWRSASCSR